MTIRGLDNGGAVFALTVSAEGSDPAGERPALVFVRDENRYRLSQVWESSDEGLAVEDPAIVARQAKAEPATTAAPTVVLVANLK